MDSAPTSQPSTASSVQPSGLRGTRPRQRRLLLEEEVVVVVQERGGWAMEVAEQVVVAVSGV